MVKKEVVEEVKQDVPVAPFTFSFIPSKFLMQKLIVKATQLKSVKDLEDIESK